MNESWRRGDDPRGVGRGRAEVMAGEVMSRGNYGARIEGTALPDGRQVVVVVAVVGRDQREAMTRAFQTAYECFTGQDGDDA